MQHLEDPIITVKEYLLGFDNYSFTEHESVTVSLCQRVGEYIAKIHKAHIIHGDLTTSNMMVNKHSILVSILIPKHFCIFTQISDTFQIV